MKRRIIALAAGTILLAGCGTAQSGSNAESLSLPDATQTTTVSSALGGNWNGQTVSTPVSCPSPIVKKVVVTATPTKGSARNTKAAPKTMYVSTLGDAGLNLRTGPGTENRIILSIPHGAAVRIQSTDVKVGNGKWYKVTYKKWTGYVYASYLGGQRPE